jgi:hypothetical protein
MQKKIKLVSQIDLIENNKGELSFIIPGPVKTEIQAQFNDAYL